MNQKTSAVFLKEKDLPLNPLPSQLNPTYISQRIYLRTILILSTNIVSDQLFCGFLARIVYASPYPNNTGWPVPTHEVPRYKAHWPSLCPVKVDGNIVLCVNQ